MPSLTIKNNPGELHKKLFVKVCPEFAKVSTTKLSSILKNFEQPMGGRPVFFGLQINHEMAINIPLLKALARITE